MEGSSFSILDEPSRDGSKIAFLKDENGDPRVYSVGVSIRDSEKTAYGFPLPVCLTPP